MFKKLLLVTLLLSGLMSFAQASSHQATLSWLASPDAAANSAIFYNVYRLTGSCPVSPAFAKIGSTPSLTMVDTNVVAAQTYCYMVRSAFTDANNNVVESIDSDVAQTTIPLAPPAGLSTSRK